MAHLLKIPENVMIQHIFPCLNHNDLLRLRRVSKQTKAFADAYLWTPQPGHQGKWELIIDSNKECRSLQAFLQLGLPPPSRLHIVNKAVMKPSEQRSFFEDEHWEEFMERYSKYVTNLSLDKLFFPFTSKKEVDFYESLVNLEKLRCKEMITIGGPGQFEEKTERAEGRFLIRPIFKKLKIFKLDDMDCVDSMLNFINGMSNNLEELMHPFSPSSPGFRFPWRDYQTDLDLVQELIGRRGMRRKNKLLYDWRYMSDANPLELLRVFDSCRDNGVIIKNLDARLLNCILCDENGRVADRNEVVDPITEEWIWSSLVKYHRNLFVGSLIHSLKGVIDTVFLMEMPALEKINAFEAVLRPRHGYAYSEWPNLRKMYVWLDNWSAVHFDLLWGQLKRPKLEELCLINGGLQHTAVGQIPRSLVNCCENLKRLTIRLGPGDNKFFLSLWEGLPLLEDVTLIHCSKLTNKGFVGNGGRGSTPAFLKLEKLKHLKIKNLEAMPRITDAVFKDVFRHLKLSSLELSSDKAIRSITLGAIWELHTGKFAKTIEKLDLDDLVLENVSQRKLKQVVSCFRCSKML